MSLLFKISISAILLSSLFIFTPAKVLAQDYGLTEAARQAQFAGADVGNPTVAGKTTIPQIIGVIIKAGLSLIGILFFGLMLYGGFMWMRAMGNAEHVTKAKETIEAALIGIVLILAAYAITSFVFEKLEPAGGGGPEVNCAGQPDNTQCGNGRGMCQSGTCVDLCNIQFKDKNPRCVDQLACRQDKFEPPSSNLCIDPNAYKGCCHSN